jgi:hypothetical protein
MLQAILVAGLVLVIVVLTMTRLRYLPGLLLVTAARRSTKSKGPQFLPDEWVETRTRAREFDNCVAYGYDAHLGALDPGDVGSRWFGVEFYKPDDLTSGYATWTRKTVRAGFRVDGMLTISLRRMSLAMSRTGGWNPVLVYLGGKLPKSPEDLGPTKRDYHMARLDRDGWWSHKPGENAPERLNLRSVLFLQNYTPVGLMLVDNSQILAHHGIVKQSVTQECELSNDQS